MKNRAGDATGFQNTILFTLFIKTMSLCLFIYQKFHESPNPTGDVVNRHFYLDFTKSI